jgi:signal transduction histidine kinase/ActR/RegA family two-component response regulator/Tfp pilus assembly protein PilF
LLNIGLIYQDLSDYDKSLEYFFRTLKIRESLGDKSGIANAFNSIGIIYMKLEDYDKALEYYQRSLRIYEKSADRRGVSRSLGNIGIVYGRLGKYQRALNYHKRARTINEGLNSKEGIANCLNNAGDIYRNLEEYNTALEHHEEALKINKEISHRDGIANSLNNIGLTYMRLKKYKQAVKHFLNALEIKKEINDKNGTAGILTRLGEIYIQTGRFEKAGGYIKEGLALARDIKAKDTIKDCYKALSDLNHKKNNFEQAYKYFTLYAAVKDSMLTRDSSNKIARLRARMVAETEQQKKKIEILKRDNAIKGLNLERERLMRGIYMTAIFVFALLVLIILYMYRMKSKSSRQLRIAFENSLYEIAERERIESEKQLLQEELFQAQKMDSIGMLAGGIAHDFNNLLTGIMGYAEILAVKFKDNKGLEGRAAQTIYKNSLVAQDLTKRILGFARKGKYNPVPLNLNDVINEAISVSGKIFQGNITVNYRLEDHIHSVDGDRSQLVQVLTNLVINARDAMPNGGEITLQTENVYVDEENTRSFTAIIKPGHYVRLAISDTGTGIPREIKSRIFEPFFTTKEKGKGTGLGLATVYGIIRNHGGCIMCQSEPGKGTTFVILLPFGKKELQVAAENETDVPGMGTILVADDEEYIRQLSRDFLERLGYHVLTAANGKEAVDIYKNNPGCIDMVLLDIIMPVKDGEETFRELKSMDPNVKVLLFSGFSMNKRVSDILKDGAKGFVEKPFTMKGLSAAVNKVINPGAN